MRYGRERYPRITFVDEFARRLRMRGADAALDLLERELAAESDPAWCSKLKQLHQEVDDFADRFACSLLSRGVDPVVLAAFEAGWFPAEERRQIARAIREAHAEATGRPRAGRHRRGQ